MYTITIQELSMVLSSQRARNIFAAVDRHGVDENKVLAEIKLRETCYYAAEDEQ